MSDEPERKPDDPMRAVRDPFRLAEDWDPLYGHCSKCGNLAVLVEDRWWHDGAGCDPRKAGPAEFILDDPEPMEDA